MKLAFVPPVILLLTACSSAGRPEAQGPAGYTIGMIFERLIPPHVDGEVLFVPSSKLTITGSPEDVRDLTSIYDSFNVEFSYPLFGIRPAGEPGWSGQLEFPLEISLGHLPINWPLKVKLIGERDDGKRVMIREQVFREAVPVHVTGQSIRMSFEISSESKTFTVAGARGGTIDLPRMRQPHLTITGSDEDVRNLSIVFESFSVWIGDPVDGHQRAIQNGWEAKLELPWEIPLNGKKIVWPLKIKLVGKRKDGVQVVIRERVFEGVE